ncbi:MAG: thiamine pyrophosphate-dependent enzyme, partial [Spirochaetota bacterium]
DQIRTPGVDMTAGSLGQGISCAVGIALACALNGKKNNVFAIVGDGESQEGQVWESAMFAGHRKLDNLIAFTDYNKMQIDGTVEEVNTIEPLADKWRAFGWEVFETDGHNWEQLYSTIMKAKEFRGKPKMIIAHTVKAKGNSCVEGQVGSHNVKVAGAEDHKKYLAGIEPAGMKLPY